VNLEKQKELFMFLDTCGIAYTSHDHIPLCTAADAERLSQEIPGAVCKNLFLKDSKGQVWLISALMDTKIPLKQVAKKIGAPGLRFADEHMLTDYLGVTAGSATPFGLINDTNKEVNVILDAAFFAQTRSGVDLVGFHPLSNDATIVLHPDDLKKVICLWGFCPMIMDFNQFT